MQGPDRESAALIPTSVLVNVVEVADRVGLPTDRWLAGAGLSAETLNSPDTRVSFRQAAHVLRHAVRAMPRGLGIDVGARDMFVSFGVLGLAIRSAENLGAAMQVGLELHQSAGSLMDVGAELIGSDSVAAALLLNGVRTCRTSVVGGEPRAPYCLMGVCFDCLVTIDGVGNRQGCQVRVADGMRVETQHGKREIGR